MNSENNNNILELYTQDNSEINQMNLRKVKTTLKRSIMDYESMIREKTEDEFFDVFNYLQDSLGEGFAEPTIRKWLNPGNQNFPEVEKLITLCKQINDFKPLKATIKYLEAIDGTLEQNKSAD